MAMGFASRALGAPALSDRRPSQANPDRQPPPAGRVAAVAAGPGSVIDGEHPGLWCRLSVHVAERYLRGRPIARSLRLSQSSGLLAEAQEQHPTEWSRLLENPSGW